MQKNVDWSLTIADDGSKDQSPLILSDFGRKHRGRVSIRQGPSLGVAANYLALLQGSDPDAAFVALSDQDDIWSPKRLSRAVGLLGGSGVEQPRIYASRTWQVSKGGSRPKLSRQHPHFPCFENALLQNILAGNTMVLNQAAMRIVRAARIPAGTVPFHDWWLYALLAGAGAKLVLDDEPTLFYRQHDSNVMGAHSGMGASARRLKGVLFAEYGRWLRRNTNALEANRGVLTPDAASVLSGFSDALNGAPLLRGARLLASGAFRQSRADDFFIFAAAAMGRI